MATLGLPQIYITFTSKSATAIARSARGVGAIILNDENIGDNDGVVYKLIEDVNDIPTNIEAGNVDLLKKSLLGTPLKVHAYFIPPYSHDEEREKTIEKSIDSDVVVEKTVDSDVTIEKTVDSDVVVTDPDTGETDTSTVQVAITDTEVQSVTYTDTETIQVTVTDTEIETVTILAKVTQADALQKAADVRLNYICHPTGNAQDQQDLASWVMSQRNNRQRTVKAVVANYAADNYGVINFTTDGIKVENPAYTDALALLGDETLIDETETPKYIIYSPAQYTARIMGILAGVGLDRSVTYYELGEVVSVNEYDDIDAHIDKGELCLFDEKDGNGIKIARGINSLHTFTSDTEQDFRFIKIIESLDLIKDDISDTFRNDYVGKVINSYENKMLFIAAIQGYFNQLDGNVLDRSNPDSNFVEIDYAANLDYAKRHGAKVDEMNEQQILEYNTGMHVFLTGSIRPTNSMEDLTLSFTLN